MAADYDKKYNARNALRSRSRVNLKVRSRSSGARISLERESRKWDGKFSLNGEKKFHVLISRRLYCERRLYRS